MGVASGGDDALRVSHAAATDGPRVGHEPLVHEAGAPVSTGDRLVVETDELAVEVWEDEPELPRALARVPLGRRVVFRILDLTLGLLAAVVFLPVAAFIAWRIKAHDGGPVLFCQERVGRDGTTFTCYKFRTMRPDAEEVLTELLEEDEFRSEFESAYKLRADPRVTAIGDRLRRTGLDELPQLLNVLNGTMSLVGPRPLQVDEVPRYGELGCVLMAIKPGVTGPWQISGRNDVPYAERVRLDAGLAIGLSAWSYLRCVVETALRFLGGRLDGGY